MDETLSAADATHSGTTDATVRKTRTDTHLWGIYFFLVIVAVIELFTASIQEVADGNIFRPVVRHGGFLVAGLALMLLFQRIHYRYIYGMIPFYTAGSLVLMVAVHFAGSESVINEAKRALVVAGVQILPAEFLKLGVALGMAWLLTRYRDRRYKGRQDITYTGLVWCIVLLLVSAGLLFEHGLSNTIIVLAIGFSMMLVGGMQWTKFLIALAIVGSLGAGAYYIKTNTPPDPEVVARQQLIAELNGTPVDSITGQGRGTIWNNRLSDHFRPNKHLEPYSEKHQQEQLSYMAQAHGGLTGVGIGRSRENARLPLAYSDYIYAIIIEEGGLFAGLFILLAYLWLLGRSAKLSMCFQQTLPSLLAMACAFTIVFQALYHMAIVSGVFPVSGQPLPLISRGGISVIATSMAFGIMLSVARHAVRITDSGAEARHEKDLLPNNAVSNNPTIDMPADDGTKSKNKK